jgi:hypothetical protein
LKAPKIYACSLTRKDHVRKALAAVGCFDDAGGGSGVDAELQLVRSGCLERILHIAVVEADEQALAVALAGTDILGPADGESRRGNRWCRPPRSCAQGLEFFSLTMRETRSMEAINSERINLYFILKALGDGTSIV